MPFGFAVVASDSDFSNAPAPAPAPAPPSGSGAQRRKRKARGAAATPSSSTSPATTAAAATAIGSSSTELEVEEVDGEEEERDLISEDALPVEEPAEAKSVCAERWRNAGPEARKKMFALFATTGIFACLCRHGQVLVLCDMIRSGEL